MGGTHYFYVVPYHRDTQHALDRLREREFRAGRYYPVMLEISFRNVGFLEQVPGARHASIEDAVRASRDTGTRSILDISAVAEQPTYCSTAPLGPDELEDFFGTTQPTREQALKCDELPEVVDRGQCRHVVLFKNGAPDELLFVGCSFD